MGDYGVLDLMGYVQKQGEMGEAKGKTNRLASLSQQAYGANGEQRNALVGQMVGTDPTAGMAMGDKLQSQEDNRLRRMEGLLNYLDQADKSGNPQRAQMAWQREGVPFVRQFSQGTEPTANWAEAKPMVESLRAKIAMAKAGQEANSADSASLREFNAMTAGMSPEDVAKARRFAVGLAARPSSAGGQTFEMADENGVPTRYTFNPVSRNYERAMLPGGGAAPVPQSQPGPSVSAPQGGDPFASLTAGVPGLQVTSRQRTPEHNANVGGVANSYHLTGQAMDILPPSHEQGPAVRQWAAGNGMEVIDEGDHWHLEPRGSAPQGGTPLVGRRKEDEAGAVAAAQEQAKINALPQRGQIEAENAGMTTAAQEAARLEAYTRMTDPTLDREARSARGEADVKRQIEQADRGAAFQVYEAAMAGLNEGLAGTTTGPIAGRLPAFTSEQQIAEGGVAAMAPILKQLFRSSGEGVFTDKDQELLMRMVPTRTDTPEARKVKMRNIDNIVRAKMRAAPKRGQDRPQGGGVDDLLSKYGIR